MATATRLPDEMRLTAQQYENRGCPFSDKLPRDKARDDGLREHDKHARRVRRCRGGGGPYTVFANTPQCNKSEVIENMARIAGVDLPREKRVEIGLTYVFGIGRKTSNEILAKTGINPDTRVKDLTEEEAAKLREVIERDYNVEGDLRREIGLNIKRLVEIGCYRGLRHRRGLPVRGQRTKTNARTRKGPKKTIANKKK